MDIHVREATREDMPAVLELIKELAEFEKEPEAVETDVALLQREGFGQSPLFYCFVAEVEGKVEGIALVYYRFSTWKGRTLHLEDLVVRKEKRGMGIGGALYRKVMEFAKEQGVKRVEWVVLDWNHHAIAFYERSGARVLKDWNTVQMDQASLYRFLNRKL